jgi:hypothetical protein
MSKELLLRLIENDINIYLKIMNIDRDINTYSNYIFENLEIIKTSQPSGYGKILWLFNFMALMKKNELLVEDKSKLCEYEKIYIPEYIHIQYSSNLSFKKRIEDSQQMNTEYKANLLNQYKTFRELYIDVIPDLIERYKNLENIYNL